MKHLHFTQSVEALRGGGLGKAAIDLHKAFLSVGTDSFFVSTKEGTNQHEIPSSFIGSRTGPQKFFTLRTSRNAHRRGERKWMFSTGMGFMYIQTGY